MMNRTAGSAALIGLACPWPCLARADRPRPVKPVEQGVVEVPLDHRAPRAGTPRSVLDMETALRKLAVPALLFAGRRDPIISWQATARTAARLPNAGFVLVDGPHTPVKQGGACLAQALDAFARTGKPADRRCSPPR